MNWRRIKTDQDSKHYKEWRGGRGRYRIIWRDRAFDVTVQAAYLIAHFEEVNGRPFWETVNRGKRLKRTLKAAKRACEDHANPKKPKRRKSNVSLHTRASRCRR